MLSLELTVLLLSGAALAQVPVTTQTRFPAPSCTQGPSSAERLTVNYNVGSNHYTTSSEQPLTYAQFESVERAFPLSGLTPIGEYNLLNFANINFVDTDPDFDGNHLGLAPHTYPYAATFGAGTSSLTGQTPLISIDYIESTLSSFTPRSFWYGCVLPSPYTAGSLPVSCDITATGYSQTGAKLASQTFAFKTNGSVVQDQNFGTFKGFSNIHSLGFSVSNSNEAAALIDNFIATLEQQSCRPYYLGSYNNAQRMLAMSRDTNRALSRKRRYLGPISRVGLASSVYPGSMCQNYFCPDLQTLHSVLQPLHAAVAMAVDDLIGTLSDGDISDEESGEEEVVVASAPTNKRKRDTKAQTPVKKQRQEKDEDLDPEFEFENDAAGAVALVLDTWANGVQDNYDSIEALVARRQPRNEAQQADQNGQDHNGENDLQHEEDSEDVDEILDGSEEDEEEYHTAIDDTMEDSHDNESNSEDAGRGGADDEIATALPTAHPNDDEEPVSASEAGDDAAEREKANAFFADGESKKTGPTATAFHSMNLSRPILKGLASVGFDKPTPIQMKAVPVALEGKDLVGGAVTGSGKTAAFLIPILERLLYRPKRTSMTRVAILMPTRELALQCFNVAKKLSAFTDISVAMAVGGLSIKEQDKELKMRPDIVIATPGRFIDLERNYRSLDVGTIEILVLDEADRMLEEGFADELNEILSKIPKSRQTMLFSATMTTKVDDLVRSGLQRPVRLMVDAQKQTVSGLTQEFVRLRPGREQKRLGYLMYLCEKVYTDRVIIFFRQKKEAHRVRVIFALCGLKAAELHGSMSQEQRINSIEAFRTGKASYLLATDLASRGLDIKGIDTVINYEAPQSHEIYLHRVGRTARAGRSGCACTLAAEPDRRVVKAAVKTAKAQGAIIKQRTIEAHDVDAWVARLAALEQDVEDVMREEKEERALSQADRDLTRADNIAKHEDEIMSRPKKTWFESEKDKQAAKDKGKMALNGEPVVKAEKKKGKLSNKEKKRLQDKDDRREGAQWTKSKKATVVGKARDEKGREKQAKHKSKPKPKPKGKK
ncbi:hypothetical protein DOTSEDRAFT_77927 [Dothistroma septosporum NZE10]|uniref:RNA helicase n=1 Tax=Dothistroma septosporum (strain NZE10 / CBS 128990) TaxID=675120 RepID=N1PZR1_DOTSN|nr:hypothetical protein DOTSEDRAFT_77927 [Dothistroma septosporum NZE10]